VRTEDPGALYDAAQALVPRVADPPLTGRLLATYATARALAGDVGAALALVDEAERLAERSGGAELRLIVAAAATDVFDWLGRHRDQLEVCERAVALLHAHPELGGGGRRGRLLLAKGAALGALGHLRESGDLLRQAALLAEQTNDNELRGYVILEEIWREYVRGNNDAALAHVAAALRVGQELGSGAIVGPAFTLLGALYCVLGEWPSAVSTLEQIAERVRHGRLMFEPIVLAFLAEAHLGAGDPLRAVTTADAAVAAARRRGTKGYEVRARLAKLRIILRTEGASARATLEPAFASLEDLIAETGSRSSEPYMRLEHAELARLLGDQPTRERELRAARAQFVEWDAAAMVARVDALLG
jgi:tetratricopeptide (TPR) repeat protein